MSVNLIKSRTVFFPDIPQDLGKQPSLYLHFTSLQEEMSKQVVGLFDNDAALRDALNTAVSVAVTAPGDMVIATGTGWGILPIGSTSQIMFVNGTQPAWGAPTALSLIQLSSPTTGVMPFYNATTGWTSLPAGSEGQHLLYKTDSGRGVWTTDLGPTNDPTATDGKMLVSSGSAWKTLSPGSSGQLLTISGTMPTWVAPAAAGLGVVKSGMLSINTATTLTITGLAAQPKAIFCNGGGTNGGKITYVGFGDGSGKQYCAHTFLHAGTISYRTDYSAILSQSGYTDKAFFAITFTNMTATGFSIVVATGAAGSGGDGCILQYSALG